MTGATTLTTFYASHGGSLLNIGGQNIAHKLNVTRSGVTTVLATVNLAASTTTSGTASFSYTTASGDLIFMTVTPSALLTASITNIQGSAT